MIDFFKTNNVLSSNQFGFVGGFGASDAMIKLTTEIINNLNSDKKCLAVFLDLAKAFDTMPHDKLLRNLERYGIRGRALKLLESYLSNRYQMLKLNNVRSEKLRIVTGIPQDTVLGPLLVISNIHLLLGLTGIGGMIISYADDTVLIFAEDSWEKVRELLVVWL